MGDDGAAVLLSSRGCGLLAAVLRRSGLADQPAVCRWALQVSLADPDPPPAPDAQAAVALRWDVLAGRHAPALAGLVDHHLALGRGRGHEPSCWAQAVAAHLERGLARLANTDQLPAASTAGSWLCAAATAAPSSP